MFFSLRLKVCVLLVWRTFSVRVFQTLGATILKARSKNRSRFEADLRTVGRVESVKSVETYLCHKVRHNTHM